MSAARLDNARVRSAACAPAGATATTSLSSSAAPTACRRTSRRDADAVVALSAMTLPHGLVRVLLAEQLYRAHSVLTGHPYHRE